jgi:tetratricopeptide (TPR) repeat protein
MFDLMGFHPDAGAELLPVTKEIVDLWKTQQARRPPQRVDPDKFEPFDSITGDARIWFRREENGDYAFYDRPGFDPGTGEQLSSVTREVIDSWRKQRVEASSKKCYIIARDPREPVRYGDRPGIDPATGRQCRELTPEMVERLQEYAKGNRPKRVEANDPTFFDLRTGEPLVWYYKNKSGTIEIFDLMGFHPETGDELVPITKEVVELWKSQRPQQARPPQRIDPDKYPFFDPRTGEPRVWYWRGGEGRYEFYDNQGFHPRTGEPLKVITREVIDKWKQETEAIEKKKKAEEERHQLELQERAEREEKEKRDQAAREERRRREAIEEQERQTKVGLLCDQLAANPNDPRRVTDGVAYDLLRSQAKDAVDACTKAVQQSPDELRYQYQLGRAMELINRQKAFEIQKRVASQQYPAAFDNLGWLYFTDQRNSGEAINQFLRGMQLNDPDSMVSLADMIDRHVYTPSNASDLKLSFLKRAADLGHQGAMRAYNIELEKIQAAQTQKLNEQEMQQRMFGIIDGFIQRIPRN